LLIITGSPPNFVVTWKYAMTTDASSPHVGPESSSLPPVAALRSQMTARPSYAAVVTRTEAALALAQMGFTKQEARAVVEEAASDLPGDASLETLVRAALRRTKTKRGSA
jgi:hypothetical protein